MKGPSTNSQASITKQWHIPLTHGDLSLSEALADLTRVSAHAQKTPLLAQLVENPRYRVPGIKLFNGRVAFE